MDSNDLTKAVAIIALAALVVGAVSLYFNLSDDDDEGIDKFTLYIGMGSASDERVEIAETEIQDIVTKEYKLGYTTYKTEGASVNGDGSIVKDENTIVLMLIFTDGETVNDIVESIKDTIPEVSAILVETEKAFETLV